ncbi:MAG: lipid IV(A) 3-deoxy-D-manno-octulosonic acid transferase [Idiomarina sp.]|nr:lipid IV(A) 3-deoxy-D-manno-octulosonic acid transferase [Idiomarina sp.]
MNTQQQKNDQGAALGGGWIRAIYSIVLTLALPAIYTYLWWHGRNNQGYRERWAERAAWQDVPPEYRRCVVFHCVSVGELMAAKPLIEQFLALNPQQPVAITCTTPTGSALVKKLFGERVYHCYLPFDTPLAVRRFINRLKPRALVILETELWPNLVSQAHQHGIKLMLVNARMSERSANGYHKARLLMGPIWGALDMVIAQDNASAERFIDLGCEPSRVHMPGNIKFDVQISAQTKQDIALFKPLLGDRQVITFGSTHEGEESQALEAFAQILNARPDSLLILVPRHQERFDAIARLVENSGLTMVRRSSGRPITKGTQVLLADTMGEMLLWFGVSTIATIGGSLIERGGHNPLEAMAFGLPIVSGRHVFNFADVYRQLDARQAVRWVADSQQLHDTWLGLLVEPGTAQRIGAQAQQLFAKHRGATQRSLGLIATTMTDHAPKELP